MYLFCWYLSHFIKVLKTQEFSNALVYSNSTDPGIGRLGVLECQAREHTVD